MYKTLLISLPLLLSVPGQVNMDNVNSSIPSWRVNWESGLSILAYGGNGFIGSTVLRHLLDENPLHRITLVSRGNWYFDSEAEVKPRLKSQIICDRDGDIDYCPEFLKMLSDDPHLTFDLLLDFSAYKPQYIEDTLELLKGRIKLYVYISTDSVYEVSSPFQGLAKEEYAKRPEDEEEQDRLNEEDAYGDEKLQGEEVLETWLREKSGPPYLIFRLPDVIGPRDTTERWWTYQLWLELYSFLRTPIPIPSEVSTLKTSYVYVNDIAKAISLALEKYALEDDEYDDGVGQAQPGGHLFLNQAYNLGLEETMTLKEFLTDMANHLGVQGVQFNPRGRFNLFPSVTRGGVDISKVKRVLGFQPTPWSDVLKETCEFYRLAFKRFKSERDDIVHQLSKVIPRERKGELLRFIDKLSEEGEAEVRKEEL